MFFDKMQKAVEHDPKILQFANFGARNTMRYLFPILIFLCAFQLNGQTTVQLKRAKKLAQSNIEGRQIQKLIGDVWIVQGTTNIFCDSAYLDKLTNSAEAFGHVNIIDSEDLLDVKSDYMRYDGNTKIAQLRDNVILKDSTGVLYTDYLDYDRLTSTGFYQGGGRLVDATNDLVSKTGKYYPNSKIAHFFDSVRVNNEEFYLESDTLYYSTLSQTSETVGYTKAITTQNDTLVSQKGLIYNANTKFIKVFKGEVRSAEYRIKGDTLLADDFNQDYRAYKNVELYSVQDSLTIYGEKGIFNKAEEYGLVYERAYLRKMVQGDSLFIKADTLYSKQKEDESGKYLLAYNNARLYKSNFQGKADSVSYNFSDSTIYMFKDPIIWAQDSQISADSLNIEIKNNSVNKMILRQRSFVISKDTLGNFNQIKGRKMDVFFRQGNIHRTDILGNGESIYYVQEKPGVTSMNKMKCSNMAIYFENNFVSELRAYREIDGRLIPPIEILTPERTLRGFKWRVDEKPKLREVALHLRYDR